MERIHCKYAEYLLVPNSELPKGCVFETVDGVKCRAEYLMACNNEDGEFDGSLNDLCQEHYGCGFDTIKSIWISRLGYIDGYWQFVKLVMV